MRKKQKILSRQHIFPDAITGKNNALLLVKRLNTEKFNICFIKLNIKLQIYSNMKRTLAKCNKTWPINCMI